MNNVKGTGIRCKNSAELRKEGNFEQLPKSLIDYVRYGLIKPNDVYNYFLLLGYDNKDEGYAFPTIETLMLDNCVGSDNTIHKSIKRLINAGLIRKEKSSLFNNKNIYFVDLPHSKDYLDNIKPEIRSAYGEKQNNTQNRIQSDKARLNDYLKRRGLED